MLVTALHGAACGNHPPGFQLRFQAQGAPGHPNQDPQEPCRLLAVTDMLLGLACVTWSSHGKNLMVAKYYLLAWGLLPAGMGVITCWHGGRYNQSDEQRWQKWPLAVSPRPIGVQRDVQSALGLRNTDITWHNKRQT